MPCHKLLFSTLTANKIHTVLASQRCKEWNPLLQKQTKHLGVAVTLLSRGIRFESQSWPRLLRLGCFLSTSQNRFLPYHPSLSIILSILYTINLWPLLMIEPNVYLSKIGVCVCVCVCAWSFYNTPNSKFGSVTETLKVLIIPLHNVYNVGDP